MFIVVESWEHLADRRDLLRSPSVSRISVRQQTHEI